MLELPVTAHSSIPARDRYAARCPANLQHHRLMLAISAAVVALAFLLEVQPEGRVAFRGFAGHPLPHTCLSRVRFGVECPGCGLTRSFIHLARADFAAAWALHPCGWILALATLAQFPYRIVVLARGGQRPWPREWSVWFGYALVALLLATWLARMAALPA
jgi:hypothetical protein